MENTNVGRSRICLLATGRVPRDVAQTYGMLVLTKLGQQYAIMVTREGKISSVENSYDVNPT